jgi:hypothetical protein
MQPSPKRRIHIAGARSTDKVLVHFDHRADDKGSYAPRTRTVHFRVKNSADHGTGWIAVGLWVL